jgi:hypothetical protein
MGAARDREQPAADLHPTAGPAQRAADLMTAAAMALDAKTNLLHVGTSQGRSVFDGLVRVANTEIPVTTAISAVGGMIAEQ